MDTLTGPRVTLRAFRDDDLDDLAALLVDTEVRRFFPARLTREESAAMLARHKAHAVVHGFAFGALETKDLGFIGMLGCAVVLNLPFSPVIEVGWLLRTAAWGKGYASEGARLAIDHVFATTAVREIVAFTPAINAPSRAVMARLGMVRNPGDDFIHPRVPRLSKLQPHVLYRLRRPEVTAAA